MYIILADAELELTPELLKGDVEVQNVLKGLGKENKLLDNYLMNAAINRHLKSQAKRIGFPSIAYFFYRMNEESVLNESTRLEYAIHTKQNVIIEKGDLKGTGASYVEFTERVEKILESKPRKMKLVDYLDSKDITGNTVVLHPRGSIGLVMNNELNYIIGGFPTGDFSSDLTGLRKFAIYDKEITVPAVLELLHFKLFRS
jgi:rRNA pseudouridine-1189 N-methylase Emg1 (Nep1/Mra1 family)